MTTTRTSLSPTRGWPPLLLLLALVCFFCVPLFVGLGDWDLRNDEAIYAYSVDRILETGDWLTPRSIPTDEPFLEKPPLKFWMTAGAIRAGLLPHDEFGLRFIDALFGALAFVYTFRLGCRLSGPVCGFVAAIVLFTFNPLLFDHGLRSNTMDAALVLAYCGGVYHFARWVEEGSARRRSAHALATAAYFTLGFMTKFVAVLFLPLVCGMAFAWRGDARERIRAHWRDWMAPALLAAAVSAPWFLYQAMKPGSALWHTIFAVHVYTRFTGALDPRHLQPWHYYFSHAWAEFGYAGSRWIAAIGLVVLAVKAWTGRPWLARLVWLWWLVPFVMMSIGTSKVFHYTYPFLPPIALGAGVAAECLFRAIERSVEGARYPTAIGFARRALLAGAIVALAITVWTALAGRVRLEIGGVALLTNATVSRPLLAGALLLFLAACVRTPGRALAIGLMAIVVPVLAYPPTVEEMARVDHPLRALTECAIAIHDPPPQTHLYSPYERLMDHSYYYYLRRVGPWSEHDAHPGDEELQRRLSAPGQYALVVLSRDDYRTLAQRVARGEPGAAPMPRGVALSDDIVLLTPGPFDACAGAAVAAGGHDIRGIEARGMRH